MNQKVQEVYFDSSDVTQAPIQNNICDLPNLGYLTNSFVGAASQFPDKIYSTEY